MVTIRETVECHHCGAAIPQTTLVFPPGTQVTAMNIRATYKCPMCGEPAVYTDKDILVEPDDVT